MREWPINPRIVEAMREQLEYDQRAMLEDMKEALGIPFVRTTVRLPEDAEMDDEE